MEPVYYCADCTCSFPVVGAQVRLIPLWNGYISRAVVCPLCHSHRSVDRRYRFIIPNAMTNGDLPVRQK